MSAAASETVAKKERQQKRLLGESGETRLVLLVDDNEDALELLSSVLAGAGHDVRSACDAPTALDMVKTWQPEIAILDIGLPVMDGYALAAQLRAALGAKCPRLIALTGYGEQTDRKRSVEAGFDAHLVKPVDTRQLIATIAELGR